MNKVIFFKTADKQLDNIFDYSYDNFGFTKACNYIKGLHQALEETANTKKYKGKKWKQVPKEYIHDLTDKPLYFIHYQRHIIFFRDFGNSIGVISIIGDCQDIPSRIREAL